MEVSLRNTTSSSETMDITRPPTGVSLRNNTSSSRIVDEIVDIPRPPGVPVNISTTSLDIGEESERVLKIPLPIQPIEEVMTSKVIGTSVESQVEENLGTQRREVIMIEYIHVPQRPSAKANGEYQLPGQNAATVATAVTTVSFDSKAQSVPTTNSVAWGTTAAMADMLDDPARVVTARQQTWNSIAYLNYIEINNG